MMRDAARDFALIEFAQFDCELRVSNFIEEEAVPSDAEQIGSSWKRANKDGSRDRRFNDNYQIPVLRYGALYLSSPTGLAEAYQISSYEKATGFAEAIASHKRALETLNSPPDASAPPAAEAEEPQAEEPAGETAFVAKPRKYLAIDWTVLALVVTGIVVGSVLIALR